MAYRTSQVLLPSPCAPSACRPHGHIRAPTRRRHRRARLPRSTSRANHHREAGLASVGIVKLRCVRLISPTVVLRDGGQLSAVQLPAFVAFVDEIIRGR